MRLSGKSSFIFWRSESRLAGLSFVRNCEVFLVLNKRIEHLLCLVVVFHHQLNSHRAGIYWRSESSLIRGWALLDCSSFVLNRFILSLRLSIIGGILLYEGGLVLCRLRSFC